MEKQYINDIVFDGYTSHDIDFFGRLTDPRNAMQIPIMTQMMHNITNGIETQKICTVVIVKGHSDRVDDGGLSSEEKRKLEYDNSKARCENVRAYILDRIASLFQQSHEWVKQSNYLGMYLTPCGASDLVENASVLSESQRMMNRRVELIYYSFKL